MLDTFAAALQHALCAANAQYCEYCQEGRLGPLELRLVRPGTFLELRAEALRRGASAAQRKPPVAVKREWERELLERCWVRAPEEQPSG